MEVAKQRKVKKFFREHGFRYSTLCVKGAKQDLSGDQILAGMCRVYDQIQDGAEIPNLRMGWAVYDEARAADADEFEALDLTIDEFKAKLEDEANRHRRKILWIFAGWILTVAMMLVLWGYYGKGI